LRVEDKEKRKGEKKESRRSEKKVGNESAKEKKVQIFSLCACVKAKYCTIYNRSWFEI